MTQVILWRPCRSEWFGYLLSGCKVTWWTRHPVTCMKQEALASSILTLYCSHANLFFPLHLSPIADIPLKILILCLSTWERKLHVARDYLLFSPWYPELLASGLYIAFGEIEWNKGREKERKRGKKKRRKEGRKKEVEIDGEEGGRNSHSISIIRVQE